VGRRNPRRLWTLGWGKKKFSVVPWKGKARRAKSDSKIRITNNTGGGKERRSKGLADAETQQKGDDAELGKKEMGGPRNKKGKV